MSRSSTYWKHSMEPFDPSAECVDMCCPSRRKRKLLVRAIPNLLSSLWFWWRTSVGECQRGKWGRSCILMEEFSQFHLDVRWVFCKWRMLSFVPSQDSKLAASPSLNPTKVATTSVGRLNKRLMVNRLCKGGDVSIFVKRLSLDTIWTSCVGSHSTSNKLMLYPPFIGRRQSSDDQQWEWQFWWRFWRSS